MAKQRARKNKPAKKAKNATMPLVRQLDANAAAYAELLRDPCQAPLTHPVYSGGDGGYLGRYEVDFLTNNTGVGAMLFAPGCIGISADGTLSSAGNNSLMHLINTGDNLQPTTDTAQCRWAVYGGSSAQPGYSQLYNISATVRPVAACMQVFYPGSELDRKGIISMARVNAGAILGDTGNGPTVAQYRAISNLVTRTPAEMLETRWVPGDGDQLYTDPTLITGPREVERKNGILLTYSGLPPNANGSIRIRVVVVYEWMPGAISGGILSNASSRARSANSLDHVLNALDRMGNWWMAHGPPLGKIAYGAYKSYQVFGGNPPPRLAVQY